MGSVLDLATIYDIAKKTGFSASTVARALNGNGYCSPKTQKKILAAADELGYMPYEAAKTLKNSITNKIMLCIPDIMNPYYFAMIHGVTQTLEGYGYNVILSYTMHSKKKELEVLDSLRGRFVDGLIFGSFDYTPALMHAIQNTALPTVLTSYYENSDGADFYDCVYMDQPKAAWTATKHCLENGHTEIAFLGGNPKEQNTRERFEGYQKAMREAGLPLREELILTADFTREGAHRVCREFLQTKPACTAMVACNDLMGVGCMIACREAGLHVPEELSIVSLDNTDYCLCTDPPMTSVDMMQGPVGVEAARFVMERILSKRNFQKNMSFSPNLILRESVQKR